jgi:hypothetical protein
LFIYFKIENRVTVLPNHFVLKPIKLKNIFNEIQ